LLFLDATFAATGGALETAQEEVRFCRSAEACTSNKSNKSDKTNNTRRHPGQTGTMGDNDKNVRH